MPRYDAKRIEPKWQAYWEQHQTFVTSNTPRPDATGKLYALDMFPYPSGDGLHVGHPEGYTATDIVCRSARMRGKHVLHPMGWDAFGLPAEQHAINTGTHPSVTTDKNIANFRRQLKSLGFSYDWSRELSTTDEQYYRWTQWIFLQLYDTWFDPTMEWTGPDGKTRLGKGRPIAELPIPHEIEVQGISAIRTYQDQNRLAYQSNAPVNWCPALGTVLANEEITADGKSDRGNFPVERRNLRQWMLRITSYAERLIAELEELDWPESVKLLQRNWIGRSVGAEVDFLVESPVSSVQSQKKETEKKAAAHSTLNAQPSTSFETWKLGRSTSGFPKTPESTVIRVYTTRPDTLYGATYMVLAPEHPLVDQITTETQQAAVEEYRRKASLKSDLDRTDLAKEKSGVFTGAYAINPINAARIPIWIADYVLISYGTGAIMAVPAHDERDAEFAQAYDLPVIQVVQPPEEWLANLQGEVARIEKLNTAESKRILDARAEIAEIDERIANPSTSGSDRTSRLELLRRRTDLDLSTSEIHDWTLQFTYSGAGTAINSGPYDDRPTAEVKQKITADLHKVGLAKEAVNYRLRDWLFSRQRYWGEPFPIWHELDANGTPTGQVRPATFEELPVTLPEMEDFKPKGTPDPPLSWAPDSWLYKTAPDGVRLKRETNSMPQWAGSCWYYIRFCDNENTQQFIDPKLEQYWLPVDLYIGGAEHAVLHLLYSRFWHKVLFDRGHVSQPEPFKKLVNQGMILGDAELTGYVEQSAVSDQLSADDPSTLNPQPSTKYVSAKFVKDDVDTRTKTPVVAVKVLPDQVEKRGSDLVLKDLPDIVVESRAFKMSKSRGNVINPDDVVETYGADSLRLYEMFMGPLEQTKPWSMSGVEGVYRFLGRVWRMVVDDQADEVTLSPAVQDIPASEEQLRILHKTIKAVTEDIDKLSFNTAISRMMEFTNAFTGMDVRPKVCLEQFVLLVAPFAPHLAEELWQILGHTESLTYAPWPVFDPARLVESELEIPVQVNGKLRAKIKVPAEADQATLQALAAADETVQAQLAGKTIVKVVCVPKKMVNFVVK
ncbi:leucine--tRNA ligase [Planctomicrobium piriforme]|uniref:Leucine--tRNA ligase n=1 Tax=Planctomicrobium piriforme TaxID=1576369 RepID=A0A1I3TLL5_9PLAN|nr:class I tRNA ligase family protein [Planctomicrobium piriforme]SFJ71413.1 leucyl-tRNA synthetase [Planctomicrobium piriforme]